MHKDISIVYNGKIPRYLLNVIVPMVICFVNNKSRVELLSGSGKTDLKKYFNRMPEDMIVYNIMKPNRITRISQISQFLRKTKQKKIIVLTERYAIIIGILSKLQGINNTLIIFKQGALAEEIYFLTNSLIKKIRSRVIEKLSLIMADEAIFVSNKMAQYYKEKFNYKKKFYIINNKAIIPAIKIIRKRYAFNRVEIVYAGSTAKWQNMDYILKIFKALEKKDKHINFKIITNDMYNFDKYKIGNLTVAHSNPRDIVQELSKSDIGIIVRDSNLLNRIASPLKIGEYLSAGLSVILTENIGCYSDLIRDKNVGCIISGVNLEEDVVIIRKFINDYLLDKGFYQSKSLEVSQSMFLSYDDYKMLLCSFLKKRNKAKHRN